MSTSSFTAKTALVTGANSGLGFEAAAQLAEAGYGRIILACRSLDKAEGARAALAERVGSDPFGTLAIDVADIASSKTAAAELVGRGQPIDALLLNAGMVPGDDMKKTSDGLEIAFAASLIGHHLLTLELLKAGLLDGARVVLVGSEAANDELPAMMGMKLYDFASGTPAEFGADLHEAMLTFARGEKPELYEGTRYYSTTKAFSAWWSAAMARRFGDKASFYTVSPGSNMGTNAARNTQGFKRFLFTVVMPAIGPLIGWDQPVHKGARRYVDVLNDAGADFRSGKTYTSAPKKMVGPLHEVTVPHLLDTTRQDTALAVLNGLAGVEIEAGRA